MSSLAQWIVNIWVSLLLTLVREGIQGKLSSTTICFLLVVQFRVESGGIFKNGNISLVLSISVIESENDCQQYNRHWITLQYICARITNANFFYYFIVINQYVITLLPISISAQNYVVISMADTTTALMLNTVRLLKRWDYIPLPGSKLQDSAILS